MNAAVPVAQVLRQMSQMRAGECRWIGREGIHVYCHGSRVGGRYDASKTTFRVVTASRDYEGQPWLDLIAAANIVASEATK